MNRDDMDFGGLFRDIERKRQRGTAALLAERKTTHGERKAVPMARGQSDRDAAMNPPNPKQRYGDAKVPLGYVPPASIIYEAFAFQEGADKYGPFAWRNKAVEAMTYVHATLRHILAYQDGEFIDPESGKPHLGLAKASLGILIDATEQGNLIDNRPIPGQASKLLASMRKPEPPADERNSRPGRREDHQCENTPSKPPCACAPGQCWFDLGGTPKYVYCRKAEGENEPKRIVPRRSGLGPSGDC